MATSHEPLKGGYDVDENAIRFSNYFHVLRELVHLSCGWLPLEPRLEVKYAARRPPPRRRPRADQDQAPPVRAAHAERLPRRPVGRARRPARPRRPRHQLRRVRRDRLRHAQARAGRRDARPPREPRPDHRRAARCACSPRSRTARSGTSSSCRPARPHAAPFEDLGALPIRLREVRAAGDHAAARPARSRRLRPGHRGGRHLPHRRAVRQRRGEPRPDRPRGAEALLPRADGRRAVRRRADGAQLARAPGDAVGLPRRHGAPVLGRDPPRRDPRPPDGDRARLPLGRLPGRLRLLQVDLRARPAGPAGAVQRHQRAEGDVAPLAPPQGADRPRPEPRSRACSTTCSPTRSRTCTTACGGARTCWAATRPAYREKVRELRPGLDRTGQPV